jgi:hypothetical protein
VLRAFLVAAVLCISFEVSGLGALLPDVPCTQECPTDRYGGECAPNCRFCDCCSLPRTVGLAAPVLPTRLPDAGPLPWSAPLVRPPTPEPRAIWHVPRPVLA